MIYFIGHTHDGRIVSGELAHSNRLVDTVPYRYVEYFLDRAQWQQVLQDIKDREAA